MCKVVKGVKENGMQVDVYDISVEQPDISEYDRIGIVSGNSAFQLKKPLMKYLSENLPEGKEVFIIYAYGVYRTGCMCEHRAMIMDKESVFLGEYGCLGFDTFGPFKVFGHNLEDSDVEQELRKCAKYMIQLLET